MPRPQIHTHNAPPCLPQWRNKPGWIVDTLGNDFFRIELQGGHVATLHESEFYRVDDPPEPATETVMVGHCPVTVPASVAAERAKAEAPRSVHISLADVLQAAGWLTPDECSAANHADRAQTKDGDMIDNGQRIYCATAGRFVPAAEWHSKLSNPPRMGADWKWPTPATVTAMHATQAAGWLTITKQVQDLPAANDLPPYVRYDPEHRTPLQAQRDELVSKVREMQERHRLELDPYMQMLVRIEACAPPPRFVIPINAPKIDPARWFGADTDGGAKD